MPTDKRGRGRPPKHGPAEKGKRSGRRLTADVDPAIRKALARYLAARRKAEGLRLTQTQVIEMALLRLLKDAGYWPK